MALLPSPPFEDSTVQSIERRTFLGTLAAAAASLKEPSIAAPQQSPKRLLFNWDGSMIHCFGRAALGNPDGPLTKEQFSKLIFDPLAEQSVDAVLFSFGNGNVAEYQSRVLEWPGEADRFQFPESKTWHGGVPVDAADQYRNPQSLAEAGANPPHLVVNECHRRGMRAFVSYRMNDCHDGQHPKGTIPNPELPTFKRQNADWLVEDLDWWTALDFSHPQVQALKLKAVEEFFDRWDFDGIELDWLRHTLYFPRGTEQENAHHLTQFMRKVRESLNRRAVKRGRPIELAVRIPERIAWCEAGGFEIASWISEDLVDSLILGQGLTSLPTLAEFRALMGTRKLPIYPCMTPIGNGYMAQPDEVIRGTAANLWNAGADGLYAFNWFYYGPWRKALLAEIAEPGRLAGKNKRYIATHRVAAPSGQPGADYVRYSTQGRTAVVPFSINVKNGPHTVELAAGGNFKAQNDRPKQAYLWLEFELLGEQDVLTVTCNDHALEIPQTRHGVERKRLGKPLSLPASQGILGLPANRPIDNTFSGTPVPVPVEALKQGTNRLTFTLKHRTPELNQDLRITRLEIQTGY